MRTVSKAYMKPENCSRFLCVGEHLSIHSVGALFAALTVWQSTAATLIVTNTSASGLGSLQQAILDANASSGLDTIIFQVPGPGVHTITPASALPSITDSVVIDGTTQPGFSGMPVIEIDGANAGLATDGLSLAAGSNTIRGLIINRFGGAGLSIQAASGTNVIQGNFIGTDATGSVGRGNGRAPTQSGGVWIRGSGNLIGGLHTTNRNLISGNGGAGVYLQNCAGNTVQGNLIGTSASGTAVLGNSSSGVSLNNAGGNQIGGASAAARNVISGNGGSGILLTGAGSTENLVQGNYIGTDASGSVAIANAGDGVTISAAASNTIGGPSVGARNLLSGNNQGGVGLKGIGTDSNRVQGNYIGTDATGTLALGNTLSGITILGGNSNLIGGTSATARNLISANKLVGVYVTTNSMGNQVQGNFIGVDATATGPLGNVASGIAIDSASFNTVGGTTAAARNIVSGNGQDGIVVFALTASGNRIQGNYIGTDVTGLGALANTLCGVHIQSPVNTIGGPASGAGNLISGNLLDGVFLDGASASSNLVQGNFIGTTATGTSALRNSRGGVGIASAPGNTIGGTSPGAGNLISANANSDGDAGIYLIGSGAKGNFIQGNKIGTDVTGTLPLGNIHEGIYLERAPSNTIGGEVVGAGNLISANKTRGIFLVGAPGNIIQGNLIGTRHDGTGNLGNTFHSVECETNSSNTTIGGTGAAGNHIAFAQTIYAGVRIRDGSTNNAILGNAIFSNGALGIDLSGSGVTANDACDADAKANMLQNFPVLAQAVSGNGTSIRGTLNSRANRSFVLQFFATPTCDSSGNGEGQVYLGQQTVVTSNNCAASFVASFAASVPVGYSVTATATDGANNTSEFSACVPVGTVPALTLRPFAADQVALSWTNSATGFVLQQASSLSPVIQWTIVTNAPVIANGQFVVTVSTTNGNRFYRLSFE